MSENGSRIVTPQNPWTLLPALLLLFPVGATAASLSSVSVNPMTIVAGSPVELTIAPDQPTPPEGAFVTMTAVPSGIVNVFSFSPQAGAVSASWVVTTGSVDAITAVEIQASYGGATKTATVIVHPRQTVRGVAVAGDLWADVILGQPDFVPARRKLADIQGWEPEGRKS